MEKNRVLFIKLYPEISNLTRDNPPIASFIIRVVSSASDRKALTHPVVKDRLIKNSEDFVWPLEVPVTGKFIIDVEFLDLKTASPNGGEPCSIWAVGPTPKASNGTALEALGRMLTEGIHTDIVINASDGSIGAHRAVLATRSPVFRSMFSHNLKEKELSTINIEDMSIDACQAFLNYLYGSIKTEEFLTHRLVLLHAADKYDISDQLPKLKSSCLRYLVKFGKLFDVREDFNSFLQCADRDLIAEVFHEVLNAWRGF